MKKLILVALLALLLWWVFSPSELDAVAWEAAPAPTLQEPKALSNVQVLAKEFALGPEALILDDEGNFVTGLEDGRIVTLSHGGEWLREIANTGGRPLGLDLAPDGRLIVADAHRGLLAVNMANGEITELVTQFEGKPFVFIDDVIVSKEGVAYYTQASDRFSIDNIRADMVENAPNGAVFATDLNTGDTRMLLDGLHLANGLVFGPGQRSILINESARYRVSRLWLEGSQAGLHDILVDNLPGVPDNITYNGDGILWVALYAPRSRVLDWLAPYPFLRELLWKLPKAILPEAAPIAGLVAVDLKGQVRLSLGDHSAGAYHPLTSVLQVGDTLYLGSLHYAGFAVYRLTEGQKERLGAIAP